MAYTKAELVRIVVDAAKRFGIDPEIAVAQITQESNWRPCIKSYAGAQGIAQFMPATAKRFGLVDRCDPRASMTAWGQYMTFLLRRYGGDYRKALAGYNAGEGNVDRYGGIPPFRQTQDYVRIIMSSSARSAARKLIEQSDAGSLPAIATGGVLGLLLITGTIIGANIYASRIAQA